MDASFDEYQADVGYELFYRALHDQDGDAWADLAARYRPLLVVWARRCVWRTQVTESYEDVADYALARAWVALSKTSTCGFTTLAAALGYLRTCVSAVVIDLARAQACRARLDLVIEPAYTPSPEHVVTERMSLEALWHLIHQVVNTEQERVAMHGGFVLGLTPRQILEQHSHLFDSVEAVYSAKRALMSRLRRDPAMRELWEERGRLTPGNDRAQVPPTN